MLEKPAKTQVPIHEILAKRWSPRAFDPNKPVTRDQLVALLEAARWAPSCRGEEPWRFLIFDKHSNPAAWEKVFSCLEEGNQKWVKNVPLLILVTAIGTFNHNGQPNRWAQYDCGAACENLCLQATHLGLITHPMGGFKLAKTHELLGLPVDAVALAMIAIGYQASPETLEGDYKNRELADRQRKPLQEISFEGQWGVAFNG